ncbi:MULTISPECIES: DUF6274 family protein [Streptomyces]|uniref:DUF6274 family protein n=1 Tax=Streptomyces glycanivorans TaxID=3033808 RepID=A0ABY9JBN4_9ACTN|nr:MULTISPECIES: DUF6274 family protein [unclassified Streptomyces]WSQ78587.1 DUF6274 family protein [Streptomyces sp. NBC_01213]TXS16912.1 hypothetical protein EAO68_03275 [Streptomyces sp. wa22]WLQ65208.1 DUF6274 family protein [Streptomyces sp. Alt3]WSQ85981.1 DUF6274 family protein [Streptomyces sp. NBC_01212]WSR07943.1 DUF6274 family protein [Streptomyces sp. NBC_01208]
MSASTERHETRALLRAHLAAASGYRHLTRHCPICHRLLRLAMEPLTAPQEPHRTREPGNATERPPAPHAASDSPTEAVGAPHPTARPRAAGPGGGTDPRNDPAGDGPRGHPDGHPGDESPPAT